jgi:transposase
MAPRVCLMDPYAEFVTETLTLHPTLRSTRLFDMIKARGFLGSQRTVRKYVANVRPRPRREAFLQLDPLKGEQAQVDWAYVDRVAVPGGERPLWLFVMVLSHSRAIFGEFVFDIGAHGLCRSLVRAASFFGGSTRRWLFDNAKAVVIERYGDVARFHPALVELSAHYRAQLRLCQVRKANQKGKVERAIRYVRERFLAGRTIHSIAQGNREFHAFLSETANCRPHPTRHGRTVADCWNEERQALMPLPEVTPSTDLIIPVVVDRYANARLETNRYSVPPAYAGRTLTLVAGDDTVRIIDGADVVAQHPRCWGKRQLCEQVEHRRELMEHKRQASDGTGRTRLIAAAPEIAVLLARWVQDGRNLGSLVARTLKLLDLYGQEAFADAAKEAVRRQTSDLGALALLCEQQRRSRMHPVPLDITLGEHIVDRDVIPHDLEKYDANR